MNREIKFRAWDGFKMYEPCVWMGKEYLPNSDSFIETDLMQFSGLNDMNNNPIYEGDILGTKNDYCFITWREDLASFALRKDGWMYDHYFGEGIDVGNVEVIGNIYENPELLKTNTQ